MAAAENQPRSLAALAADEATRTQRLAARTSSGNTALHRASAYGGVAIIRAVLGLYTLLRRSTLAVDAVNAVNDKGRTPLVRAARWGRVEEARELLRAGADAGIEDKVRPAGHPNARLLSGNLRPPGLLVLLCRLQAAV